MSVVRATRADADFDRIDDHVIALVKGMLVRGDKQSDIAACFLLNGGRVSEINNGMRGSNVKPAAPESLPPPGPYPSPYDLWRTAKGIWRTRVALEKAHEALLEAMQAVHKVEER